MVAKLRHIFAVLCGAAIIFASCSSGGGSSTKASLAFSEDITVTDSANTLTVSDVVPYSEKSFGVYVKDGIPADITVVSDSAEISVNATKFSETADSTSGEYLSTVTYSLNGFEDASAVITVTVGIDGSDTLVGKINLSATVTDAVDSYKVSNLVQTLDEDSNPTSEHNVSLSWTLPEDVSVSKLFYRVVQTSENGEEVSDSDAYDSGIIELAGDAVSLTTSGSIPSSSEFIVYIYTLTADGWSVSSAEGVKTAADTTPPVTPSVASGDNSYGTVYLVYTKAADSSEGISDDTYSLKITIPEGAELVTSDTVKLAEGTTDTVLVNSVKAGESLVIPFKVEHKNTVADYMFSVVAYDKAGNAHTDTEGTSAVEVTSSSVADTVAPEEVTGVILYLSSASKTLSWSYGEFSDDDFECVKIYVDGSSSASKTVASGEEAVVTFETAPSSSVKITACDTVGNESDGVTVIVAAPVLSGSVSAGYTGQLVVSDVSLDSEFTWTVSASDDSQSAVYDSDSAKLYVSGLTVGTEVNPSAVFIAASSDYTVKYLVAAENAGTPTMTVWKLANSFTNNSYYLAFDLTEDRTYANGVIATASEITEHGCLYDRFIVWPGLASGTTDISLELSNSKAEKSGYFVMTDSTVTSTDSSWWRTNSWESGCNEYTLFAVQKDSLSSNAAATYIISDSAYGDDYILLNWAGDTTRYVRGFCYHAVTIVPGSSTTSDKATEAVTGADYAWIPTVYTWTGSEAEDAPTSIDISATKTSDHSITFSWTDPSDVDFDYLTVTTGGKQADGTTDVTVPEKIESGVQTVTFSKLAAGTEYSFTFTLYDVFGNSTAVNASGTTSADSEAPSAVTGLSAAAGRSSVTLDWTASASDDVKEYKVYVDGAAEASVTVTGTTASVFDLSAGTEYSFAVKAFDYDGNESESVSVSATPAIPAASNVAAEARYTGSVLVTWTDTTAQEVDSEGNDIVYTYEVTLIGASSVTKIVDSGVQQAHFTGLELGTEFTGASVKCMLSDDGDAGEIVSVEKDITVSKVLWKISNTEYTSSTRNYRVVPAIYTGSTYATSMHIIIEFDGSGSDSNGEWKYLPYTYWEVLPALADSTDGSRFSLMASTKDGLETGLYFYGSKTRSIASGTYYSNHWGSSANLSATSSFPVLFFVAPAEDGGEYIDTANSDDLDAASFSLIESDYELSGLMLTQGYESQMYNIYTTINGTNYYWEDIHTLCEGSTSSGATNAKSFAIAKSYLISDLYAGAPNEVTDVSSESTATTVNLTWTNPSDADFDHVVISWGANSVSSTSTSTVITGLSSATSYDFTIKTVDMMGNESDGVTISVATASGVDYPTAATAVSGYTGQIVVTWTDATMYSDYTYTVTASTAGEDDIVMSGIEQGVEKAVFNDLTIGNTYTFTLVASYGGSDYEYADSELSAQAVKVLWYLKGGYGDRIMMCNILSSEENGCTTDYSVIAEAPNQTRGESGGCAVVNFDTLTYHYWLVLPNIYDPNDCDKFSLMATDSTGTESGYYLYVDASREVSSTANLKAWWTSLDTVNGWANKLFVAKTSESYITDNKLATFSKTASAYDDGSWFNLVCASNGYYVQHSNLVYRVLASITEENCAALKATETFLTK